MFRPTLKKIAATLIALAATIALFPSFTAAGPPPRGMLYLDGEMVRTLVPPAAIPHGGRDPLYMVTNGAEGQLGIAGVGPGYPGYHGGAWAVYQVTFAEGVTPYLLESDEEVADAAQAGDVTVTRAPQLDNRCPVQR
jgi:hypothetical protein